MSATAGARARRILPVIIISQFAGTSLWFAGNAVLDDLRRQWDFGVDAVGYVTSAVQLGFIAGTLAFAVLAISDRYSPRKVFFLCSLAGALLNLCVYFAQFSALNAQSAPKSWWARRSPSSTASASRLPSSAFSC